MINVVTSALSTGRSPLAEPEPLAVSAQRTSLRILVVDDERSLREGCATFLEAEGYSVSLAASGEEAVGLLRSARFDIVLTDLYLSPVTGMDVLKAALAAHSDTLVVVMTGNASVATSIEALREGAWDYLAKPFPAAQLRVLFGRAARHFVAVRETRDFRRQLLGQVRSGAMVAPPLLGTSPALRRAVELARRVARTDAAVMITGESGTGKELIAQYIHRESGRANCPLVPINCAALPEPLLESEMFGHRKGAFTGADRDKRGLLEAANGGTLFLDELTEMSLGIQAKLLRVLQDGVVRRVGSEQQDAVVNVRVISASNVDPEKAVQRGMLRQDLFYRLRVVPIELPPLRERSEDIPLLAKHFLQHHWERHHPGQEHDPPVLMPGSLAFLRSRRWRGNVRELQNLSEHLAVLAEPGQRIEPDDLPVSLEPGASERVGFAVSAGTIDEPYRPAKDKVVSEFDRIYLTRLVDRTRGNLAKAARLAGIDRTTLYRLLEKHGLDRSGATEAF